MRIGWNLNAEGIGRGKHYGSCFQDPTVLVLTMAGDKFRTTLIQDGGAWFVLELCEPMSTLIDCSAEFFGYVGDKFIITIITSSERPPQAMGFTMLAGGEEPLAMGPVALHEHAEAAHVPIAPEDDDNIVGIDVDDIQVDEQGADIPQGQVVIAPERGDHLLANGVEIFSNTALATMRGVCSFYNLSTSGSKDKCFKRLLEHQKKAELQLILGAAREAQAAEERQPRPQHLAEPPDEEAQMRHNLCHLPFADWCASCVAHRARPDRQENTGAVKESSPTVSFDFAYAKSVGADGIARDTETVLALVMVHSVTNFVGCVPVRPKSQTNLTVGELLQFTQVLGHVECTYLCDNEPAALQVHRLVVLARKAMGLPTKDKSPAAYSHGNALCENSIARIRSLAGSLMHRVQQKLSVEFDTNSGLWSWAFRHAAWLLNRFSVVHGTTPFELAYGKVYKGRLVEFGEPAFSYVHTTHKGNPPRKKVLVLGKAEGQDIYVVFTGRGVMQSRSIRRIATDWKAHLGSCVHFNAPTWCFKTGLGSRIIPTRRTVEPWPASSAEPVGPVLPSALHGADGEAVKQKAREEKQEEGELQAMGAEDVRPKHPESEAATTSIPVAVPSGQVEINDFLRRIWMMARKRQ